MPAATLVSLLDAELAFGDAPLLDRAALTVLDGERIGLIGRNGTGKSSLLRVLAGRTALDDGTLAVMEGLRIVLVEQEPLLPSAATLRASLVASMGLEAGTGPAHDERLRWRTEARLVEELHRSGLDEAADPQALSGGERKRAALAAAFALEPDLLLLDEPTNHLDLDGIALLEERVLRVRACLVITHDRAFLDRVATRIVELDRGLLHSYPGNWAAFEARRAAEHAAQDVARRRFDKFWAQEEAWIRKGIEARRTRNAGRVARLQRLREERAARRERIGNVRLTLDAGARSGRLVAELQDVSKSFGPRCLVRRLSLRILRGDRIGVLGPNGAGKSTLLKLILGQLAPDSGAVRLGTHVQVAYFDQLRAALDPERTVADTIAPGSDTIEVGGTRKHVISYLEDFLFPPRRASAPVKTLSGGERNRLLLARLFAQPANVLVLDEPTNDLDLETLELLESTLQDYAGTLLLVSHDRAFLDQVVTQTLAAEGDGAWKEYVGGYSDWLAQRPAPTRAAAALAGRAPGSGAGGGASDGAAADIGADAARTPRRGERVKLSYKESRELEALPAELEALEAEQAALTAKMAAPDYHRAGADALRADRARLAAIEHELAAKFERWAALDDKAQAAASGN